MSPIEMLLDSIDQEMVVDVVLIPEQCAVVYINGISFHVTIEKIEELYHV